MRNDRLKTIRQFADAGFRNGFAAFPEFFPQGRDKRIDMLGDVPINIKAALRDFGRKVAAIEADDMKAERVKRREILAERVRVHNEIDAMVKTHRDNMKALREDRTRRELVPLTEKEKAAGAEIFEQAAWAAPEENRERFAELKFRPVPELRAAWEMGSPRLFGLSKDDADAIRRGLVQKSTTTLSREDQNLLEHATNFDALLVSWRDTADRKIESVFDLYREKPEGADAEKAA